MENVTVITCAITGAATQPSQTPYLPIKPEHIVQSGLEAAEAGASILHIHVRDPNTGYGSMDLELYRFVFDEIKKRNKDVLINLTTGPGGNFNIDLNNLPHPCMGTSMLSAEDRVKHIQVLKPDLCSLDFNTMNQAGNSIRFNHKQIIKEMLELIQSAGTKPELEIFGSGDYMMAREFVDQGYVKGKPLWQFAMGVKYGWNATPQTLTYALSHLTPNSLWSAFGIGKEEMPMVANTWLHGGHVRVGLEDNIYLEKNVLAKTNAELVTKAVRIIKDLGGSVADYSKTREIYVL